MGASSSSSVAPPAPQSGSPLPSTPSPPVTAAGASAAFRPSAVPSSPSTDSGTAKDATPSPSEDTGPGTFEDLHRKCKDVFPVPFEGAKLVINKGLSNHFQICHNLTMSVLQPSGYRFGCTYVGTKQLGPSEAYPVLMAEGDLGGNLNATAVHHFTKAVRCRAVTQFQGNKCMAMQLTSDYKGRDFVASLTLSNVDCLNGSGVIVGQYLQNVTQRLALGTELLYQVGPTVPGNQFTVCSLGGRYTGDNYQLSTSLTPMAGGLHVCYYQKANDSLQIGVELEGSLRTQECTATIGYQLELPKANVAFRGQLDSNWCIGAVMEKKLPPLPFTFALSAFANHVKGACRFGVGLIVG